MVELWCQNKDAFLSPRASSSPPSSSSSPASPASYPSSMSQVRLMLHLVACIACLGLGLRFAKEPLLVGVPAYQQQQQALARGRSELAALDKQEKSSSVLVGRHKILVRPYPHPNPLEVAAAQAIIDRVQREQRRLFEAQWERHHLVIAITALAACNTTAATRPLLYLSALANTLKLAQTRLVWIVVEANGPSNSTGELLRSSGVAHFHLGQQDGQEESASSLRLAALRFVKERKLLGIVVFADETTSHSEDLFDEVQKVQWMATYAVGFPQPNDEIRQQHQRQQQQQQQQRVGSMLHSSSCGPQQEGQWWAGLAFKSEILWLPDERRPAWIANWEHWAARENRGPVRDPRFLERLGGCGAEQLAWSSRVADPCLVPARSSIDPPLSVVVPWRKTPWPAATSPVSKPVPAAMDEYHRHPESNTELPRSKPRKKRRRKKAEKA